MAPPSKDPPPSTTGAAGKPGADARGAGHRQSGLDNIAHDTPEGLDALGLEVGALLDEMMRVAEHHEECDEDLGRARAHVVEAKELLARHTRAHDRVHMTVGEPAAEDSRPYYVAGPLVGPHNPAFPDIEFHHEDGVSHGHVEFPLRFEGPPMCLHGGVVALFFDQVLGHHNIAAGVPAMTGTLSVRYHKPTPLFTRLPFEVHDQAVEGRKLRVHGSLGPPGALTAEADGLFILPRRPWDEHAKALATPDPSSR